MAKFETRLSLASLDEMIKRLETKKKSYPKVALRIADRLADEMLDYVKEKKTEHGATPYKDSRKIPAKLEGNTATAGMEDTTLKAYYNEFGTGVRGSENPHPAEGIQYKDGGWWYPTDDNDKNTTKRVTENGDIIAYTKGLPAQKGYYEALQKAQERFKEVGTEELEREAGK